MRYDSRRALELLRFGIGVHGVGFREGQENAIRHIVEGRGRLLVVQKTGWGKSFVYFIATKLLREFGAGPALLISPLLALMRWERLTSGARYAPYISVTRRRRCVASVVVRRSTRRFRRRLLIARIRSTAISADRPAHSI